MSSSETAPFDVPAVLSPVDGEPLRAVVTGASSGIGAATVRRLRSEGWGVVAVARRADRLAALAEETGAETFVADVTNEAEVAALAEYLSESGPVHALVNNAGGAVGADRLDVSPVADWRAMYEVNVLGSLQVTQALLPLLRETGRADLVFVTSTAALLPYEGGGGYTSAKTALRNLAGTLRLELAGEPIRVIDIAPGAVHTEEFSLNRLGDPDKAAAVYAGFEPLYAEDVADAIVWTLSRDHNVNIDSLVIRPRAQASNYKIARA